MAASPLFIVRKPSPFVRPQLYAIVVGKQGPALERVLGLSSDGPVVESQPASEIGIAEEGREVALIIPGCGELDREELRDIARAVTSRPRRVRPRAIDIWREWQGVQERYRHYMSRNGSLRTHHSPVGSTRNA